MKIANKTPNSVIGMNTGGKETRANRTDELRIIPIPRLIKREGMIMNSDSKNKILFKDLFFEPIALMIKKSLAFSITPLF